MSTSPSPYLLADAPTSPGKVLLARAFAHWCILHHGYLPEEIVAGLEADPEADHRIGHVVRSDARLIGELIAAGSLRTFARPIGAGSPIPIPSDHWELDDFISRFAHSAFDPSAPFSIGAAPTHWIFIDIDDFNSLIETSCLDLLPARRRAHKAGEVVIVGGTGSAVRFIGDDLVRLPEVKRRTGMSRSTIYRRIEEGRFPEQVEMKGNIAAWREEDIATWLAEPM